jgi:hypothetical protein
MESNLVIQSSFEIILFQSLNKNRRKIQRNTLLLIFIFIDIIKVIKTKFKLNFNLQNEILKAH